MNIFQVKEKYKFTIITINKNNFDGLIKTIDSIRNQTYKNFQLVVVDGGSTDGSYDFIKSQLNSINCIIHEPDSGIYDAQNKGIKQALGEYIIFLNAGDSFSGPDVLESFVQHNYVGDVVYGNVNLVYPDQVVERIYPDQITFDYWLNSVLCHQVVFFKKDLFPVFGLFDLKLKFCSDHKMFYTLWKDEKIKKIHFDKTIVNYDMTGLSSNPKNLKLLTKELLKIKLIHFPTVYKFKLILLSLFLKVKVIFKLIFS
ncbi:glycosyltransferase family 2 protein [Leptospira bandrabouensis]|uniref:glycosyltransferase family 2 protein n=2 Tax=Leptospira bandrabouensis TaxID=2484903 RepID=UPI001EE8F062|nr:glycosyltransferase family 2 protein [Leptospira bandrabouensis]MCG6144907.1 glycosyltransferase [Leptospira bandrabouensis]MCG6152922.1 glycosyltransferase [Leptospira bandrabouensis]MCG6160456.1 glycosyltransferase [Leptospira bandrabouensis]MCG6164388.1 glycosyltransferase [Leptospira bandrabouensis]MCW7478150.1 glycosyltransferase [Leptospira bandrabouensis]